MTTYTGKTKDELKKALADKRKAVHNFRFASASGKVKNVKELKHNKKDIARILTAMALGALQAQATTK